MKLIFKKTLPSDFSGPFAIYRYDELLSKKPGYIDIRGTVNQNADLWLKELQFSHASVCEYFLRYSKWWWATKTSRLDARPWGQEDLIKPLFFARALADWLLLNPNVSSLTLVDMHPWVRFFLSEFLPEKKINFNQIRFLIRTRFFVLSSHLVFAAKTLFDFFRIAVNHILSFPEKPSLSGENLALYELLPESDLQNGHRYYFNSLFDSFDQAGKNQINFGCLVGNFHQTTSLRKFSGNPNNTFLVLDSLKATQLLKALWYSLLFGVRSFIFSIKITPYSIGKHRTQYFWSLFASHELSKSLLCRQIAYHEALKNIFTGSSIKRVVYPYEEKPVERSILFACQDHKIESIGYTPHPQHRFALALRDFPVPLPPKPDRYAVCGKAYIEYFQKECHKKASFVELWGSGKGKSLSDTGNFPALNRERLSLLLIISHPQELDVFGSWLQAESQLTKIRNLKIRLYRAVSYETQLQKLRLLKSEFDVIEEANGELSENIANCDLVLSSATSAGLFAPHSARLGIYVALGDFFQINPGFDRLEDMLACADANKLADRLNELCKMDPSRLRELHQKQRVLTDSIFSPVQLSQIKGSLCCVN